MGACTGFGKAKVTRKKGAIVAPDTAEIKSCKTQKITTKKLITGPRNISVRYAGFIRLLQCTAILSALSAATKPNAAKEWH